MGATVKSLPVAFYQSFRLHSALCVFVCVFNCVGVCVCNHLLFWILGAHINTFQDAEWSNAAYVSEPVSVSRLTLSDIFLKTFLMLIWKFCTLSSVCLKTKTWFRDFNTTVFLLVNGCLVLFNLKLIYLLWYLFVFNEKNCILYFIYGEKKYFKVCEMPMWGIKKKAVKKRILYF